MLNKESIPSKKVFQMLKIFQCSGQPNLPSNKLELSIRKKLIETLAVNQEHHLPQSKAAIIKSQLRIQVQRNGNRTKWQTAVLKKYNFINFILRIIFLNVCRFGYLWFAQSGCSSPVSPNSQPIYKQCSLDSPMQMSDKDSENENGSVVTPRMRMFRTPGLSSTEA